MEENAVFLLTLCFSSCIILSTNFTVMHSDFDICRLQQWLKRKILDAPSEGDAGPTEAITCPHEQLRPDQATGAKRVLVPENLWLFLYEDAIAVKPDDLSGCSAFPSDSKQCSQCSDDLSEEAVKEDSLR